MILKLFFSIFLIFFLIGCNNSSTKSELNASVEVSMQEIEELLVDQNYSGVIEKLKDIASNNDEYLALADAYMGISGLNISKVIDDICLSSDENGSALMDFIDKTDIATKSCNNPLDYLNKATNYYMLVIGDSCENNQSSLNDFEKKICTYKGLAQTAESVTSINYLISSQEDAKEASACAMQYAFNGVKNSCEITEDGNLTFTQTKKEYEKIDVVANKTHFEFLLAKNKQTGIREVVITDGYCSLDSFDTRVDSKADPRYKDSFHVCPVNLTNTNKTFITQSLTDAEIYTTKKGIVDSFNFGTHSILVGDINNSNLKDKIIEFKDEIIQSRNNGDDDKIIKIEDIVSFFNKQY